MLVGIHYDLVELDKAIPIASTTFKVLNEYQLLRHDILYILVLRHALKHLFS
jgi:hypothetical protein